MSAKDLLGLRLEEAEALLKGAGTDYSVKLAEPFFKGVPEPVEKGSLRVIRVKEKCEGFGLLLTVCRIPDEY